jgi:polysaccharide biosynthesis protein PslA
MPEPAKPAARTASTALPSTGLHAGVEAEPRVAAPYSSSITGGLIAVGDFLAALITGMVVRQFAPGPSHLVIALYMYFGTFIGAVAIVGVLASLRLYDFGTLRHPRGQLKKIAFSCAAALPVLAVVFAPITVGTRLPMIEWAYSFATLSVASIYSERWLAYTILMRLARSGRISRNVIVVGGGAQGARLIRAMRTAGQPITRVLGVFDDRSDRIPNRVEGCAVLGPARDLVAYARRHRVDDIFIALPWSAEVRIRQILNALRPIPARIHICPEGGEGEAIGRTFVQIDGVPAFNLVEKPLDGWRRIIKGLEDRSVAAAILLFLLPMLLLVALAIKLDSPGPVFFRQKRYGWNNKVFLVWKFRTMYHDKRDDLAEKLTERNDPRVTRLGWFLRRTSIDELPQFLNVLNGEMSVVGPRPHPLKAKAGGRLYDEVVVNYAVRHKIKPGVTGWAQVNGWRGDTDTEEKLQRRIEYDLYYMEHWSVFFDIYIILRTVMCVLRCNAY